jgi:hypothetical protein
MTREALDNTWEQLRKIAEKHNIGDRILIATQPGTGRPDFIPLNEALMEREPENELKSPVFIDYIGLMIPGHTKALVPIKETV